MATFYDYSRLYPNLTFEICFFFSLTESKGRGVAMKEIHQFCEYYQKKYDLSEYPQPRIVSKICDILTDNNHLSLVKKAGIDNLHSSYLCNLNIKATTDKAIQFILNNQLNCIVYGFKYIYEEYKKYVLAIEYTNYSGETTLGTCFMYKGGVATAKHCIEGAAKIAIQGIQSKYLQKADFEIHENALMDLLFIRFETPLNDTIAFSAEAEVLDEVMTLGYPKIAGYHNYLTAENANVSSRYITSIGQVASNAEDIWIKERLFLITAKIKGGNSGGAVISKDGSVVGVAVNMTKGEGNYDDLGYGTVIPVSFLDGLIKNGNTRRLDVSKINFTDFEL